MSKKEDPNDPDSFAFLLRQIIGDQSGVIVKTAEVLSMSRQNLWRYTSGYFIPLRGTVEDWPEILHKHYNLDRICEITGLSLREKLKNKIESFSNPNGRIPRLPSPESTLLYKISGGVYNYLKVLSEDTGLSISSLSGFTSNAACLLGWGQRVLIPKLQEAYPDKKADIEALRLLLLEPQASVDQIKRQCKGEVLTDFQTASGLLMREMREKCGLGIAEVEGRFKVPVLKGKLERIEKGEPLKPSIYWSAISEICSIGAAYPQAAGHVEMLGKIKDHFRPR